MDTKINKYILILSCFGLLEEVQSIDCNGKAFICTDNMHFSVCIETAPGKTETLDESTQECPSNTVCNNTAEFECSQFVEETTKLSISTTQPTSTSTNTPTPFTNPPLTTTNSPTPFTNPPSTTTDSPPTTASTSTTPNPPMTTTKSPTTTNNPTTITNSPPTTTNPPPTTGSTSTTPNPPMTTTKSPTTTNNPTTITNSHITTAKPPITTNSPPTTTNLSPTTTNPPLTTTKSPLTTKSPTTTNSPSTVKPLTTTKPPPTTTNPPSTTTQRPITTKTPPTTKPPPTTSEPNGCPRADTFGDPNSCHIFYRCVGVQGFQYNCPFTSVYSTTLRLCTRNKSLCENNNPPTCTTRGRLPDPKSCYSYFLCQASGSGFVVARYHCPETTSYDAASKQCKLGIGGCTGKLFMDYSSDEAINVDDEHEDQ